MAPQTHTRYRVQRLIRLGEWLERNEPALITAFDAINEAHNKVLEPEDDVPCSDLVEMISFEQLAPLMSLEKMIMELRHNIPTKNISFGADVTIHQPYACTKHQWEVVIEAPQPKDIPSQEEFDRVRSEVDITN